MSNLLENAESGHDPLSIPPKFKDPETGEVRVEALLKSYLALEKKLSQKGETAAPVPEKPEDYCIDCQHGLFGQNRDIDRKLHEHGFSQDQAQVVYDLAAEKMVPMIMDVAAEFQADREIERLINHFGSAEKWREVSAQLLQYGRKSLPPEVLKGLTSSYEGVIALYDMMNKGADQKLPSSRVEAKGPVSEDDLNSLMRSPKYWRDKDPATVSKVTEGFKHLYKNSP